MAIARTKRSGWYEGDLFDTPAAPPFAWAIDPGDDATTLRQQYRGVFLDLCRRLGELHAAGGPDTCLDRAVNLYRRVSKWIPWTNVCGVRS